MVATTAIAAAVMTTHDSLEDRIGNGMRHWKGHRAGPLMRAIVFVGGRKAEW